MVCRLDQLGRNIQSATPCEDDIGGGDHPIPHRNPTCKSSHLLARDR